MTLYDVIELQKDCIACLKQTTDRERIDNALICYADGLECLARNDHLYASYRFFTCLSWLIGNDRDKCYLRWHEKIYV